MSQHQRHGQHRASGQRSPTQPEPTRNKGFKREYRTIRHQLGLRERNHVATRSTLREMAHDLNPLPLRQRALHKRREEIRIGMRHRARRQCSRPLSQLAGYDFWQLFHIKRYLYKPPRLSALGSTGDHDSFVNPLAWLSESSLAPLLERTLHLQNLAQGLFGHSLGGPARHYPELLPLGGGSFRHAQGR